ncbi:MAG: fluoride efflux transporter CrcB [Lawsonibacter sp.]
MNALFVGLGGAVGAVGRYGLSLLPFRGDFPLLTLVTNLLGAILIGFVAGLAGREKLSASWTLFWKTGVCGGFTTFSTFSLESVTLLQRGRTGLALAYMALSAGLCLAGVLAGQWLSRRGV